jgi:fructose-1,6-bisphosphatase
MGLELEMESNQELLLKFILKSIQEISELLRNSSENLAGQAGQTNSYGDHQLNIDIESDSIIFRQLKESGLVQSAVSEETPHLESLGGSHYAVAFDPLDGSNG